VEAPGDAEVKTTPTPEQKRVGDDIDWAGEINQTLGKRVEFAQACALDRIAQAIERFATVVEKATKERA
jgi:hypothetical protein